MEPGAINELEATGRYINHRPCNSSLIDGARETKSFKERFETELSPIHRSTLTSTTASSEDGLASFYRSQVSCVYGRRLRARQAQRQGRPAEQPSSQERKGVAQSC